MIVIGLDCAGGACSAAVVDGGRLRARRIEPMLRGHQERLGCMVAEVMAEAGVGFDELRRVGVTIGPGSFTGLRVGLAFAKGLALSLDIPAHGVGSFQAMASTAAAADDEPRTDAGALTLVAIDARRGQAYVQIFRGDQPAGAAQVLSLADAARLALEAASGGAIRLAGSASSQLLELLPGAPLTGVEACDPVQVARLAAEDAATEGLEPLYLRAPDALLPV